MATTVVAIPLDGAGSDDDVLEPVLDSREEIEESSDGSGLAMLVECHPTLDEAVLSAWPDPASLRPAGDRR